MKLRVEVGERVIMGCLCLKSEAGNSNDTTQALIKEEGLTQAMVEPAVVPPSLSTDDFKIEKMIGKGSFGKVFLVTKKDSGALYAMKVLRKEMIERRNQIVHTQAERSILGEVQCPFIVQLHYAFQTPDKLYMVMDYMSGGELFFHLRRSGRFTEDRTRFYAAEILLALEYLHDRDIIYRDLKPENVLIDEDGHLRISDFGLSKQGVTSDGKAFTFCGTPEYLAPEILRGIGHDQAVDFWSLGALIYEMLSGAPPNYSRNRDELFRNILTKPVEMKPHFSVSGCDLLQHLLQIDPKQRLSSAKTMKEHSFFSSISWPDLQSKSIKSPFKPVISHNKDMRNFDRMFTDEKAVDSVSEQPLEGLSNKYPGFTYQDPRLK